MNELKTIARYRLTGELGRGGMGVVYHAEDPQLERRVAIKVILFPHQADADLRTKLEQRFEREARAAAGLHHPGVITVFDFGRDGDYLFLVMELVDGESLADRLREGWRPGREEALEIVARVAEALAAAHAAGVVHRDVTPHNILLARDGRIVVTDFGVARSFGEETLELTNTGMLVGSPGYMAPELVRGHNFDGRADLFSLGVILHRLLTGRKAFDGRDVTSLLYQIVHENPLKDPVLAAALDPETRHFLEKCLAKSPPDRIQDANTFARQARRLKPMASDPDMTGPGTRASNKRGAVTARTSETVARDPDIEETLALGQPVQRLATRRQHPARGRQAFWSLLVLAALGCTWLLFSLIQKDRPPPPSPLSTASHTTDRATSTPAVDAPTAIDSERDNGDDPPSDDPVSLEVMAVEDPPQPNPAAVTERAATPPARGETEELSQPPAAALPSDLANNPAAELPANETIVTDGVVAPKGGKVTDIVAPILAIDAHADALTSSRITLSGRVMDDRGSVALSVDGESLAVGEDGDFSMVRQLASGRNVFTFVAIDGAGNQTLKSIEVTSTGPGEPTKTEQADAAETGGAQVGGPTGRAAPQRFRDPGNGTLVDTLSGLMWTKRPNGEDLAWKAARSFCKKLKLGRQDDWTLPTIETLEELYWAGSSGTARSGQRSALLSFPKHAVWSSSKNGSTAAWAFDFAQGRRTELATGARSLGARTLCVRRPPLDRRLPPRQGPDLRPPGDPNRRPPNGRQGGGDG